MRGKKRLGEESLEWRRKSLSLGNMWRNSAKKKEGGEGDVRGKSLKEE